MAFVYKDAAKQNKKINFCVRLSVCLIAATLVTKNGRFSQA